MNPTAKRVAQFGILVALALVLGYFDRAIPLSAVLGGAVPGIKLGLANTVLLYAIYLMDWKSCVLLMGAKVVLSGFMFGSLNAMMYSLAGGALSLAVMLLVRRNPARGALGIGILSLISVAALIWFRRPLRGAMLWCAILMGLASLASFFLWRAIGKRPALSVMGTSLAGAVAHNVGQVLVAAAVLRTPQLLYTYLPVLVGIGAAVGCLTGLIAQRVFAAMKVVPGAGIKEARDGQDPGGC
jgi:uncharacterized membrane protein